MLIHSMNSLVFVGYSVVDRQLIDKYLVGFLKNLLRAVQENFFIQVCLEIGIYGDFMDRRVIAPFSHVVAFYL